LQNLVGNAIEAFNNCGGQIEIVVSSNDRWADIRIIDNGPGIPEAIRDRLFEPFVTHGKRGGTGLGTAIAKSIIDAHNGTIRFNSNLGEGTTFYLRFPLVK
jgi:signal transduction histidine kinase